MTAEQFAYWLQGYAELNAEPPTAEQWQSIREHLQTVFKKVTPPLAALTFPQTLLPDPPLRAPSPANPSHIQPLRSECISIAPSLRSGGTAVRTEC